MDRAGAPDVGKGRKERRSNDLCQGRDALEQSYRPRLPILKVSVYRQQVAGCEKTDTSDW